MQDPAHPNLLLAGLLPADREAVLADCRPLDLPQRLTLVEAGEAVNQMVFPTEGMVSAVALMRDARTVETFMVGYEGVVGGGAALAPALAYSRLEVQVAGKGLAIEAARLRAHVEARPELRRILALYIAAHAGELEQSGACNALHDATHRLAKWLLRCQDRVRSDVMELTQDYLASMLGAQRTTVNEAAQTLQRKGAIAYSRGRVTVVNRQALEAAACECYRGPGHHVYAAAEPRE